jgi:glycine cleavage system H protein
MTDIPENLLYGSDHLWVLRTPGGTTVRSGITDFAQQSLGDVVAMSLPRIGDDLSSGQACGDIESTKAVSDLIAPITGTVTAINPTINATPELINTDPYGAGWLFEAELPAPDMAVAREGLLTPAQYTALVGG